MPLRASRPEFLTLVAVCGLALCAAPALAQRGDKAGEAQPELPPELRLPPPEPLSPDEALKAFVVEPGWRVELVAAEPLVEAPVQAQFDADGRLWVVEMRGYMPDIDGKGETAANGRVSVLFDDDGDGRMDRAARFLDGLVLPRSLAFARDGVLVVAPPQVLFCRDTDGDFVADERTVVDGGIDGIASPEYGPNGLLRSHAGVYLCANHDRGYLWKDGKWSVARTSGGGQYGITQDESGRILHNNNSDLLRGDLVDGLVLARNPFLERSRLLNAGLVQDQSVHPVHPTPGVNRAYREGWLKDGKLQRADAACSPHVARGDALPPGASGCVYVCEPAGNLVKQLRLEGDPRGGFELKAAPALPGREVLASVDERFRPVSLCDGPDGALYVVDMQRGVIQHKNFVTSFLRQQAVERKLEKPLDRGRVWRLVSDKQGGHLAAAPMSAMRSEQLVAQLASTNGWTRDTARRLLAEDDFERGTLVDKLRAAARSAESPLARRQALEILDELDAVGETLLVSALMDRDLETRLACLRAWRRPLERNEAPPLMHLLQHLRAQQPRMAWEAWATVSGRVDLSAVVGPLLRDASDPELRRVVLSGYAGKHVEYFEACVRCLLMKEHAGWDETQGRAEMIRETAAAAAREGRVADVARLVDIYVSRVDLPQWLRFAMIDGLLEVAGRRPLVLDIEPKRFLQHLATDDVVERSKAEELWVSITWPGRSDLPDVAAPRALTPIEQARLAKGREVYGAICAACHQASGRGEPGKAPPLVDSPFLLGDARVAARIVLGGIEGPLKAGGTEWNLSMPAWNGSDAEVAAVLSYARREWGHVADPVEPAVAAQARSDSAARRGPWSAREAQLVPPAPRSEGSPLLAEGLAAFRAFGDARYEIDGATLKGTVTGGAQSFLATRRAYGDFVLEVDVHLATPSNSGIQVRSHEVDGKVRGPQVEIDPGERAWSGGLFDEGRRGWLASLEGRDAARGAFKKDGWNRYRIEVRGPRYRVQVNGIETCDALDPLDLEGFLAFQVHAGQSGEIHWRDPRVVDLGRREWRAADLSAPLEFGAADEVLRLSFAGKGARLVVRCADPAAMVGALEIASGVHASAAGLTIDFDAVPVPPKPDDAVHEWHLSLVGERVALHKDGRRLADAIVPGFPAAGVLSFVPGDAKLRASHRMATR